MVVWVHGQKLRLHLFSVSNSEDDPSTIKDFQSGDPFLSHSSIFVPANASEVAEPALTRCSPVPLRPRLKSSPQAPHGLGRLARRPPQAAAAGNRLCYLMPHRGPIGRPDRIGKFVSQKWDAGSLGVR